MAGKHEAGKVVKRLEPAPVRVGAAAVRKVGVRSPHPRHRAPASVYTDTERRHGRQRDTYPLPPPKPAGRAGKARRGSVATLPRRADRQNHTGALIGEYLIGVVLIGVSVPLNSASKGYVNTITSVIYRLSALTGVFLVLGFVSNSPRGSRFAAWFGLLVDLGIVYTAVTDGTVKNIGNAVTKQSTGSGATDLSSTEPPQSGVVPAPSGIDLGTGIGDSQSGAGNTPQPGQIPSAGTTVPQ